MELLDNLKEKHIPNLIKRLSRGNNGHSKGQSEQDIHMGEPGFLNKVFRKKELESVFLFVTSRCNSKCRTCFYSSKLNQKDDMTFEQIETISKTAPNFDKLWLSGGEPFMRKELAEIIEMFYHNNKVKSINLPTNGILKKEIDRVISRLLESCPDMNIQLNFSLDGLGATHDGVRGVPGSFKKTIEIMDIMEQKFGQHPRLHRNVATVVTPEAYKEMYDLAAYIYQKHNSDTHFFEAVRGTPRDPSVKRITRQQLETLHDKIMPIYEGMAERMFANIDPRGRWVAKLFFMGVIRYMFRIQEENMDGPCPWGMPCTAGETTVVIDHNGYFRSCEMRSRIGKLQDYDFDLSAALKSKAMLDEISEIGGGQGANCWCTHGCWIISSMQFSPRTLMFEIPRSFLGYKIKRLPRFVPPEMDLNVIEQYQVERPQKRAR